MPHKSGKPGPRLGRFVGGVLLAFCCAVSGPHARGGEASPVALAAAAPAVVPEPVVIVRLYYGDRDRLSQLVSQYDVFESADHVQGYVEARLRLPEYDALVQAGYRIEILAAPTAQANRVLGRRGVGLMGIPDYACYRTVEETYASLAQIASNHPDLASLVNIGQSWDKTQPGGPAGYDLLALVLSNKTRPGPKPRFFLMAEHHARELTTAETALRFAEELVAKYDTDPDTTWLLDYAEVHVLPMANPDGRKWAELGFWWRKNTDDTNGCQMGLSYGTDLNRNGGFKWGGIGSSGAACDDLYRGPAAFSEPENQAIRDYVRSLFPPQRGPGDTDAAPVTATGLLISLHSYSELVLFPWGYTTNAAPNQAGLQTLGGKLGFFNRYRVQPSIELYPTSGTVDDWAYGELGLASYTIEMGGAFFEDCADFENTIYPSNRLALFYAAKACRQPYLNPAGPDVIQVTVPTTASLAGVPVSLTAIAESGRTYGTARALPSGTIKAARYSIDDPSWIAGVTTFPMTATDGSFSSIKEALRATIDTAEWLPGRHTVFVEAQDAAGNWGVPTAAFVWIAPLTLSGATSPSGFVLQWPSVANRTYSVWQTADVQAPFQVVARGLPGRPPQNRYTNSVDQVTRRFYRVSMDP